MPTAAGTRTRVFKYNFQFPVFDKRLVEKYFSTEFFKSWWKELFLPVNEILYISECSSGSKGIAVCLQAKINSVVEMLTH